MTASDDLVQRLPESYQRIRERVADRIVGMTDVVDLLLAGIFSGGHCLLVGVPGLAKTLLIRTLSDLLDLDFSRIQFTPDLMPSDIIGTEVIMEDSETGEREFKFMEGPVFCQILLADEINRTPPKTQAALMEAMEERQVTMGGHRYPIDTPFFVLATQNPIEQEGTYPLPAAQLDRFTFMIRVEYPSKADEYRIIRMTTTPEKYEEGKIMGRDEIVSLIELVRTSEVPPEIAAYATTLARRTRPKSDDAPEIARRYLAWGVGPRGAQNLVMTAKVRGLLHGRAVPTADDLRALAPHVFRHRMILNFHGEAEGITVDEILQEVIETTDAPDRAGRAPVARHTTTSRPATTARGS